MSEHYYTPNPTSEIIEKQFDYTMNGKTLKFIAVSGVFGFSPHVDNASKLLIEAFQPTGTNVLDLGCGFGPIGLSLKSKFPQLNVTLCDINNRAVEYAQRNAAQNDLSVQILSSDLFSALGNRTFDDIISNPPIATGKQLLIRLIDEAYQHLSPSGSLWLVAFHNKGGSTLSKLMKDRFGNVQDIAKGGGIRVYKSLR